MPFSVFNLPAVRHPYRYSPGDANLPISRDPPCGSDPAAFRLAQILQQPVRLRPPLHFFLTAPASEKRKKNTRSVTTIPAPAGVPYKKESKSPAVKLNTDKISE